MVTTCDPQGTGYVIVMCSQSSHEFNYIPHTHLLTTSMSPVAASLRFHFLPRVVPIRAFHSPFVVLSASNHLTTPPPPAAAPTYEKQGDSSPEPHLSSSGTRTYVVSEPDPSNTPYQVPSGASPYLKFNPTTTPIPEGLHTSSSLRNPSNTRAVPHKEAGVGQSAAVRNTAAPGEMGRRGFMDAASTKPGKL